MVIVVIVIGKSSSGGGGCSSSSRENRGCAEVNVWSAHTNTYLLRAG